jgi:predicted nucleotidyltransferase
MKLIAWRERGSSVHRKDARDLGLLLTTYLRAGNEGRLYKEHAALLDEAEFDLDAAGARILGRIWRTWLARDTSSTRTDTRLRHGWQAR